MSSKQQINIVLLFLSLFPPSIDKSKINTFVANIDGKKYDSFKDCIQTNEPPLKFIHQYLHSEQKGEIDKVFVITSNKSLEKTNIDLKSGDILPETETKLKEFLSADLSHFELFKKLFSQPPFKIEADKFIDICYDESGNKESFDNTLKIARSIHEYVYFIRNGAPESYDIKLHIDTTGGFRNAVALLTSISKLLQFSEITPDKIVYSNISSSEKRIEDMSDIIGIFDLISGAEEFTRFGSIKTLQSYFNNKNKSSELSILLQTMEEFSDALKICRTSSIKEILNKKLRPALEKFKTLGQQQVGTNNSVSLEEQLFATILTTIDWHYRSLLKENVSELDTIRWCVERDLLQQALTLYVEWIPNYIVDNKLFYFCDKAKTLKEHPPSDNEYQSTEQLLLVKPHIFLDKKVSNSTKASNFTKVTIATKASDLLIAISQDDQGTISSILQNTPILQPFFDNINDLKISDTKVRDYLTQHKSKTNFIQKLFTIKKQQNPGSIERDFDIFSKNSSVETLIPPGNISEADLKGVFNVLNIKYSDDATTSRNSPEAIKARWESRAKSYEELLRKKIVASSAPTEDVLSILKDYFEIQTQRHLSNHAAENTDPSVIKTNKEICNLIIGSINKLEKFQTK